MFPLSKQYLMIKNKVLLSVLAFFMMLSVDAQKTTIEGKIATFDVISVMQAEVTSKKGKSTVLTDSSGVFSIECDLKDKLIIKASGFKTRTVKVGNLRAAEKINIEISGSEAKIDLAVANGHLNQASSAQAKKYYKTQKAYGYGFVNMTELIKAKFPQFTLTTDEIIMRGTTSLTGTSGALVVLNGATYDWGGVKGLDVATIKNIQVLTGTAANRYGSGSGNGVLLIELLEE